MCKELDESGFHDTRFNGGAEYSLLSKTQNVFGNFITIDEHANSRMAQCLFT